MADMGMSAILPSIIGSAAGAVLSTMMADDAPTPAPTPQVEAPTPMPSPNDQERKAAQRRSIAMQRARQGRAATILTDDNKLGG